MAKLTWDNVGEHLYHTGNKQGVLFVSDPTVEASGNRLAGYANGVAWNGLSTVNETPSGADENAIYADDMKYLALRGAEDFGGTIECYTYPDEFAACNGEVSPIPGMRFGQQGRKAFGFAFISTIGNDTEGNEHGKQIHIIYNATCNPSERGYQSINDSPEAIAFSFEFTTTPIAMTINGVTYKNASNIIIDSTKCTKAQFDAVLNAIQGTDPTTEGGVGTDSYLPSPAGIYAIMTAAA